MYYILSTSTEEYTEKLHNMLKVLSNQVEFFSTTPKGITNIKILVCNDNTEKHIKKEFLKSFCLFPCKFIV